MKQVTLHHAWDDPASHRVRIALALKEIRWESRLVDMAAKAHETESYRALTPQGAVPALEIDGVVLTQSLAIMDYLDETRAQPPLLPGGAAERAHARALAHTVATEMAPPCAPVVVDRMAWLTGFGAQGRADWVRRFALRGLASVEALLRAGTGGPFCHGDRPGYADCVLIPQLHDARRWGAAVWRFPRVTAIELGCASHPAFVAAHPEAWAPGSHAHREAEAGAASGSAGFGSAGFGRAAQAGQAGSGVAPMTPGWRGVTATGGAEADGPAGPSEPDDFLEIGG